MTVGELKIILKDTPDDLSVMCIVENHLKPGMFAFAEACTCETGIISLGPDQDGHDAGEVFLVAPHGAGVSEDEVDDAQVPELN